MSNALEKVFTYKVLPAALAKRLLSAIVTEIYPSLKGNDFFSFPLSDMVKAIYKARSGSKVKEEKFFPVR